MCFVVRDKQPLRVATKDIPCWKRVRRGYMKKVTYMSPYQYFEYELGFEYEELDKSEIKSKRLGQIRVGLHTYSEKERAVQLMYDEENILECYIPKGSYYRIDPHKKEYISDRLVLVKKVSKK